MKQKPAVAAGVKSMRGHPTSGKGCGRSYGTRGTLKDIKKKLHETKMNLNHFHQTPQL